MLIPAVGSAVILAARGFDASAGLGRAAWVGSASFTSRPAAHQTTNMTAARTTRLRGTPAQKGSAR